MTTRKYGWKRDHLDVRDHPYTFRIHPAHLPPLVDLRDQCPPVYDQLTLGSCTAHALAGAIAFDRAKQKLPTLVPSRLFIYYNERDMEGTINVDAGASLRDGIKSVNRQGVCDEAEWPYNISAFTWCPPAKCYKDAMNDRALTYEKVPRALISMQSCLADGYPFVFGFSVYESFESDIVAQTGIMSMPSVNEALLGGHAVLAVGYRQADSVFIVRNSWGVSWGDKGYFYMPFEYILKFASDFWCIKSVG
jgi:C1A family cysteine protease